MIIRWGIFFTQIICYNTFMDTDQITINEVKSSLDELIAFLQEHMLTKEEALGFATKDDLKSELTGFATKDDLQSELTRFATKDDLKAFATKDDLFEIKWDLKKFATHEELVRFKDEILTAMDSIVKTHRTFDQELIMMRGQYLRHEDRIEVLEDTLNISH